jgi:hypothetical protein
LTNSSKTITLAKGKKATLKANVKGSKNLKAADKKVTYKTSNKKVATVTSKGVVKGVKTGTAKITVTSKKNSKKKAKITVKVVAGKVTKVTLDQTKVSLEEGKTVTLKATPKTSGKKPNKTLKWTSSKTDVATVSSKGVVTAKKAGTTVITAQATDGTNKKATCTVTVTAKATTVTPAPAKITYTVVTPKDATVTAEVTFTNAKDLEANIKSYVTTAGIKKDQTVTFKIGSKTYTAKVTDDKGTVTIDGKSITEVAGSKTSVTVVKDIKAAKVASVIAFAPTSVKSVKVNGVTFTAITAKSVTIDGTAYPIDEVSASGVITLTGDATKTLGTKLDSVATVKTVEK